MGKTARTADTAAYASHTFDKVAIQNVFALFKQGYAAFFDTVAHDGLKVEFDILLFKTLNHRIGKTAGTGEYSAEIRCVIKHVFAEGVDIEITAIEKCLQFFKGHNRIHIGFYALKLSFCLFSGARTDKYDLCILILALDILRQCTHRRKVVGYQRKQCGESGFDILNECGTAGAG